MYSTGASNETAILCDGDGAECADASSLVVFCDITVPPSTSSPRCACSIKYVVVARSRCGPRCCCTRTYVHLMRAFIHALHGWPPPHRILRILHPSQARLVILTRFGGILIFLLLVLPVSLWQTAELSVVQCQCRGQCQNEETGFFRFPAGHATMFCGEKTMQSKHEKEIPV